MPGRTPRRATLARVVRLSALDAHSSRRQHQRDEHRVHITSSDRADASRSILAVAVSVAALLVACDRTALHEHGGDVAHVTDAPPRPTPRFAIRVQARARPRARATARFPARSPSSARATGSSRSTPSAISTGRRVRRPDEHTMWDMASLTKVVGMTSGDDAARRARQDRSRRAGAALPPGVDRAETRNASLVRHLLDAHVRAAAVQGVRRDHARPGQRRQADVRDAARHAARRARWSTATSARTCSAASSSRSPDRRSTVSARSRVRAGRHARDDVPSAGVAVCRASRRRRSTRCSAAASFAARCTTSARTISAACRRTRDCSAARTTSRASRG